MKNIWLFLGLCCVSCHQLVAQAQQPDVPHIVLIVSDDAGWADFGFQGSQSIPTPNLDRLAERGVVFSNAYAGSVCSPSRASLVTGLYNSRIGFESNLPGSDMIVGTAPTLGIEPSQPTVYSLLQNAGYQTGVIGKWHLGRHRDNVQNGIPFRLGNQPNRMGVAEFRGLLAGSRSYWIGEQSGAGQLRRQTLNADDLIQDESDERPLANRYVTDVFGDWSIDFIRQNAAKSQPFFLCTCFTAPHTPMQAKPADLDEIDRRGQGISGRRRTYAAMMLNMDRQIGRILSTLQDPNNDGDQSDSIDSKTLVLFVNDNGGDCCDGNPNGASNAPLRGGKGSSWEGGFRVPMVLAGHGLNRKMRGSRYDHPVHVVDILPTLLAAAGNKMPAGELDGVDLMPFVNQQRSEPPHEFIYLRRGFAEQTSLRMGKWKLHHSAKTGFSLFDLESNISESMEGNLVDQYPEVVAEMQRRMTRMDAQMMRPRWGLQNEASQFRFRESLHPTASWSDPSIWSDEQFDTGAATLTHWDSFADTVLIFRSLQGGRFTSVNDMRRTSGLPFLLNGIRFRTREESVNADSMGIIQGEPVVLATNLAGELPRLQLDSMSAKSGFQVGFDIQLQLQLWSDLIIAGDSVDSYTLSGGFKELNPGLTIVKKGRAKISLSGSSDLSGVIEIFSGVVEILDRNAIGNARVVVRPGGRLVSQVPLPPEVRSRISGDGAIQFSEIPK